MDGARMRLLRRRRRHEAADYLSLSGRLSMPISVIFQVVACRCFELEADDATSWFYRAPTTPTSAARVQVKAKKRHCNATR